MVVSCEDGDEPSGSTQCGEVLYWPNICWLLLIDDRALFMNYFITPTSALF